MAAPRPGSRAASPRAGIWEAWRPGPESPKVLMQEILHPPWGCVCRSHYGKCPQRGDFPPEDHSRAPLGTIGPPCHCFPLNDFQGQVVQRPTHCLSPRERNIKRRLSRRDTVLPQHPVLGNPLSSTGTWKHQVFIWIKVKKASPGTNNPIFWDSSYNYLAHDPGSFGTNWRSTKRDKVN